MIRALPIVVVLLAGCTKVCVPADRTAIFSAAQAPDLIGVSVKPPSGITGYWTPGESDLRGVENDLEEFLARVSDRPRDHAIAPGGWRYYYRQITGVVRDGRKCLFLSYAWLPEFSDPRAEANRKKEAESRGRRYDPLAWKRRSIVVSDGGRMYFRVIYDLRKREYVWYDENFPG